MQNNPSKAENPIILEISEKRSSPNVGQLIKAARRFAGLTLEELGRRIGVSNQALSAIEKGKNKPSRQTLIGLARELNEDFGESWLSAYLRESKLPKVIQIQGPAISRQSIFKRILEDYLENSKGSYKESTVGRKKKAGMIPLVGEFGGGVFHIHEARDYVIAPTDMLPVSKKVVGVTYIGEPMYDSLVGTGDVLIVSSPPATIGGEVVLLFFNKSLMIKRWQLNEDKVILASLSESYEPVELSLSQADCICQVNGVLRFMK